MTADSAETCSFFVTCPRYIEPLLADEIRSLVPEVTVRETSGGVSLEGPLETALRLCLWSRLAGRVLLKLSEAAVGGRDELYTLVRHVAWEQHFTPDQTFAVHGHAAHRAFAHSGLPMLVAKDAICDRFRAHAGERPSVDTGNPDIRVSLYATDRTTAVYLDLSGESLHRRAYRIDGGRAPLRENTAAAVLVRSGWKDAVDGWRSGTAEAPVFVDPLCGSGTLAVEAALMALDAAPGLNREEFGFQRWPGYSPDLWKKLLDEAERRQRAGLDMWLARGGRIWASDMSDDAIGMARANAERAGIAHIIDFSCRDFARLRRGAVLGRWKHNSENVFLVTNPPYGLRLTGGDHGRAAGKPSQQTYTKGARRSGGNTRATARQGTDVDHDVYEKLGKWLSTTMTGVTATVLAASREQARALGLHAHRLYKLYNGGTEIVAAKLALRPDNTFRPAGSRNEQRRPSTDKRASGVGSDAASAAAPAGEARSEAAPEATGDAASDAAAAGEAASGAVSGATPAGEARSEAAPEATGDAASDAAAAGEAASGAASEPASAAASETASAAASDASPSAAAADRTQGEQMVYHRLKKNRRALRSLLRDGSISCYRLYDADIPQHAAAVDVYTDTSATTYAVIQEYAPSADIPPDEAAHRLSQLTRAVGRYLDISDARIVVKRRKRQQGGHQYRPNHDQTSLTIVTAEDGMLVEANLTDYIDTGLFCDKRIIRQRIRDIAGGRTVLNLFAYTCTASVSAALGGARRTVSVDTSNTYLEWGKRNFHLNGLLEKKHAFVREDCRRFLDGTREHFDLIFIDPPTFSNSKSRRDMFDVQNNHAELLARARHRLAPRGEIIFTNSYRGFRIDPEVEKHFIVDDISEQTLPSDFARSHKRHHAFRLCPRA